jgi:hypothetical protein
VDEVFFGLGAVLLGLMPDVLVGEVYFLKLKELSVIAFITQISS